jgi:hypothetical protein
MFAAKFVGIDDTPVSLATVPLSTTGASTDAGNVNSSVNDANAESGSTPIDVVESSAVASTSFTADPSAATSVFVAGLAARKFASAVENASIL